YANLIEIDNIGTVKSLQPESSQPKVPATRAAAYRARPPSHIRLSLDAPKTKLKTKPKTKPETKPKTRAPALDGRLSFQVYQVTSKLAQVAGPVFRNFGLDIVSARMLMFLLEPG